MIGVVEKLTRPHSVPELRDADRRSHRISLGLPCGVGDRGRQGVGEQARLQGGGVGQQDDELVPTKAGGEAEAE
jgi:hypothetical protein